MFKLSLLLTLGVLCCSNAALAIRLEDEGQDGFATPRGEDIAARLDNIPIPAEFSAALDRQFKDGTFLSAAQRTQIQGIVRSTSNLLPFTGSFALHLWSLHHLNQGARKPNDIDIESDQIPTALDHLMSRGHYSRKYALSGIPNSAALDPNTPDLYRVEFARHESSRSASQNQRIFGVPVRPLETILQGKLNVILEEGTILGADSPMCERVTHYIADILYFCQARPNLPQCSEKYRHRYQEIDAICRPGAH